MAIQVINNLLKKYDYLLGLNLGKYLIEKISNSEKERFELVFVWNRSEIVDESLDKKYILKELNDFNKQYSHFITYKKKHDF